MSVPDYSEDVAGYLGVLLKRFPGDEERTRAHSFEQLNKLARRLHVTNPNVGLLEKLGGDRVRDRAADILLIKISPSEAQVVDVIGDAEGHDGPPRPGWSVKDIRPISQWKPPYAESGAEPPPVEPPPVQPPAQPPVDLAPLVTRIAALETQGLKDRAMIAQLAADVADLKARPTPQPPSYRVVGSTSRDFGHSHRINVTLEPIS